MTMDEYQKKALKTVKPTANNLTYVTLGLASEAGEIASKMKKWMRDFDSDPSKLDKKALADELGDVLWYTAVMSELLGLKLGKVAENNVSKLADRANRGVIGGSGDKR
jgi:NTP pyrophosphatase (non-canonical NTP hydrolase)